MRKLTVRAGDDEAEEFTQMCAVNGVTIQGCLLAAIRLWIDPDAELPRDDLVATARQIDAEARRR